MADEIIDPEEIAYSKFKKFSDRYNAEKSKEDAQRKAKEDADRIAKDEADRKKQQEEDSSLGFLGIGR
ncbi:MAG: hypothetical protein AAB330_04575 [Bacteroidota bacterium]